MIEEIKTAILQSNWNAILEMHHSVSVSKNTDLPCIFFHDMEKSKISQDEIFELKGGYYLMDFSDGSTGAVLNTVIEHVNIAMLFNSNKTNLCPQCGHKIYKNCPQCNQRGI